MNKVVNSVANCVAISRARKSNEAMRSVELPAPARPSPVEGEGHMTISARKSKVVVVVKTHEQPFEPAGHFGQHGYGRCTQHTLHSWMFRFFLTPHFAVQEPDGFKCCAL